MKRRFALASLLLGSALLLIPHIVSLKTSASNAGSKAEAPAQARFGSRVTVHARGLGAPAINLADGREALTAYAGDPEAQRLLQQNLVQPMAMASADLDEDGVPDLVSGYAAPNGGVLTLHRGNVDALYPNAPEARQRKAAGAFTDAPFLSPAVAFETPRPVDFIGCGDFDADGHWDVVTAARGGSSLYFFLGDGRGNLSAPRQVDLPGRVTALVTGEINRADGLTDIVVGVSGTDGPEALVFEAPDGALRANPEVVPLPGEVAALALGQLDEDFPIDLAVASGRELVIVPGQAQKPSPNKTKRAKVREAVIDRRSFPFTIKSLVIGDFSGNQRDDIALLSDDGAVHVLSRPEPVSTRRGQKPPRVQSWQDKTLPGSWPHARVLDRARASSLPADNVVVIDSANKRLHILAAGPAGQQNSQASAPSESLDVDGEPIAVLPMRLNGDALSDLVILRSSQVAPSVAMTAPAMTFTVSNTNNTGAGSLRQAIISANTNPGADLITFDIGSGGPQTINLAEDLDAITEAVTIDATTQSGFAGNPIIEVSGGTVANGFVVFGGGTTIKGLVINLFVGDGVSITGSGNNILERNFIGTTMNGNAGAPNANDGILVDGSNNNRIGGTAAAASNLISGNSGSGVSFSNGAAGNQVLGNFIGTNAAGAAPLGNGSFGVALLVTVSNTTLGGTAVGARNLISANNNTAVVLFSDSTTGNLVQGNLIGTNAAGTGPLPNTADGVTVTAGAHDNTIGGTIAAAGNTIAFNVGSGVALPSGNGNAVLGNSIFANNFFGIDMSDDGGPTPNDPCDVDSGPNSLQNFPVLTSATTMGGSTTITGSLNSTPASTFRVEFFASTACDPSGFGQGQTFIGFTLVNTNAACTGPINVVLPIAVPPGQVITATATNAANETSEFSQCVTVIGMGPVSDLQITKSDSPDPVQSGANITYTITVTNNGPNTDAGATFTDVIPAGATFVSLTSPGSCSAPPPGGTGTVTCSLGSLPVGGSVVTSLVVNVNAAPGATISNTAMVSGMSNDSNPGNNSATASTTVVAGACTITCPPNQTKSNDSNQCGAVVTYPPPTTSGACGAVTCAPPSGSFFPKGTTVVTCQVAGGPSCVFNIIVNDTQPPTITCPANVTRSTDPNLCSTVVDYAAPAVSDNCPGVGAATCNPSSGSAFPKGLTTVNCNATDSSANTANCSFTVTVNDTQPPTITCPANVTRSTDPNLCSAVVTYAAPTVSDNCPAVGAAACNPPSGATFPAGTTTVSCSATDSSANTAGCNFTVTVNDTRPPTITCAPNQAVAGNVPTVVNYPAPTAADNCPGVSTACNPPSGSTFPVGVTTVTCIATDAPGNTASCAFIVTVAACAITCPGDLAALTPPADASCGARVSYPAPTTSGACGEINCAPPSGSFFKVGETIVTCSTSVGPACSFRVTVIDATPPIINCPTGFTVPLPVGQLSAVVNYPAPTATDNCSTPGVVCAPPSGSRFPAGATLVTCTATDSFENSNRCFFFVSVLDSEPPIIRCPANVSAPLPAGQTTAVVNYPPPTISDNLPGVTAVCAPASGSNFPAGATTVTCTATDAGGNKASCSFIVGVGGPQARVTIPGNRTAVEFAADPTRKPPKPKRNPCSFFTIENIGFGPLILTFDSIARTGSDVDSGRITDVNDTRFFSLSGVNSDQSLTPLDIGAVLTLQPGQAQTFCAKFAALIPALAGKTTGLAASNVLPDAVTSKIIFRQNVGGNIAVPILARVSTALVLVNLSNPRTPAEVIFTRNGNDITVSCAVFDSNLDVSRAKYEFLDNNGQMVAGPFETDLTAPIRSLNLVKGQSFSVDQRFTGANSNPAVTGVRLTVFDGETSADISTSSAPPISAAGVQLMIRTRRVTLYPPDIKLRP